MTNFNLSQILFLDIETASQFPEFQQMDEHWQNLWEEKTRFQRKEDSAEEFYPKRAGILAEFGKVICISCGFFTYHQDKPVLRIKSFGHSSEKQLLNSFAELLINHAPGYTLCAHNGKEFDFPYLSRRMLVNGITLPEQLDTSQAKPWEVPHIDTLEMWKFGDRKNFTSLKLLAALFGVETSKDDIDGSIVGEVYWQENDLPRIQAYCEKDVVCLARVFLKISRSDIEQFEVEVANG